MLLVFLSPPTPDQSRYVVVGPLVHLLLCPPEKKTRHDSIRRPSDIIVWKVTTKKYIHVHLAFLLALFREQGHDERINRNEF